MAENFQSSVLHDAYDYDSPRAGGLYSITDEAFQELQRKGGNSEGQRIRARLTSMLVEMRRDGEKCPIVTSESIEEAVTRRDLHPHQRADPLLRYLCDVARRLGDYFGLDQREITNALNVSESSDEKEVGFLAKFLDNLGLVNADIAGNGRLMGVQITVDGHAQAADVAVAIDPT